MNQTFRKYEMLPTQWATAKKKIQVTNPEGEAHWNPELVAAVVELGHLVQIPAIINEQGVTEAVLSSKYSVDILWAGEPLTTSFASYVVWPLPCGVHVFAGWEAQYAKDYCEANPNAAYCQPPAPIND